MKIIVISDTHSRNEEILGELLKIEKPDMIFHLGDYVEDGEKIVKELGVDSLIVKGNGDYYSQYNEDEIVGIKGKKIFLTHGHRYNVRYNIDNLIYKGQEVGADIVLYGHTHVPINIKENGMHIMNPGSASFPRGMSYEKTYGVINIGDAINIKIVKI